MPSDTATGATTTTSPPSLPPEIEGFRATFSKPDSSAGLSADELWNKGQEWACTTYDAVTVYSRPTYFKFKNTAHYVVHQVGEGKRYSHFKVFTLPSSSDPQKPDSPWSSLLEGFAIYVKKMNVPDNNPLKKLILESTATKGLVQEKGLKQYVFPSVANPENVLIGYAVCESPNPDYKEKKAEADEEAPKKAEVEFTVTLKKDEATEETKTAGETEATEGDQ